MEPKVHTLAHGVFGQFVYRLQLLRDFVIRQLVLERSSHVHGAPRLASFSGLGVCWVQHDDGGDFLTPLLGGDANDCCFGDLRSEEMDEPG